MTRAFQYAGARSLVASRWPVADQASGPLMIAFHRHLRRGLAKDAALQRAMQEVRANPKTSHPYFWAPFFLIGDPENGGLGAGK